MFAAFERGYHACLEISSEKVKGQNEGRPAPALRAGSKDPPYIAAGLKTRPTSSA